MRKMTFWIDSILSKILIVLMAVMVLDVTWQVITRFLLQHPSSFTEELATFLLIWIGLLGASYALRTKAHLGIDILTYKLKGIKRNISILFVNGCIFVFSFTVLVLGGIRLVQITLDLKQISAALGIKMGYVYSVLPITGIIMMYYSLFFMYETFMEWRAQDTEKQIPDERVTAAID